MLYLFLYLTIGMTTAMIVEYIERSQNSNERIALFLLNTVFWWIWPVYGAVHAVGYTGKFIITKFLDTIFGELEK